VSERVVLTHCVGTRRVVFGVGKTWSLFPDGDEEVLMGSRLWVGCGFVFLWGRGRGSGAPGYVLQFVFAGRLEVPNISFYVI
jgi:hypothetical protein